MLEKRIKDHEDDLDWHIDQSNEVKEYQKQELLKKGIEVTLIDDPKIQDIYLDLKSQFKAIYDAYN